MGLSIAHFKELAFHRAHLVSLTDLEISNWLNYSFSFLIAFGYEVPADDDHSDYDAGHRAIVELVDYFHGISSSSLAGDVSNIKRESVGSWSVEYFDGKASHFSIPSLVETLLSKYYVGGIDNLTLFAKFATIADK